MNPQFKKRIAEVRRALKNADPTIGFLAPPANRRSFPEEVPVPYQEFLREVDGAACGVVMLYESEGLLRRQACAKDLPGGRQRWFCVGSVEDYPIVIDRQSGAVFLVPSEGQLDMQDSLGELDYFLHNSVFGPEYADFVTNPEDDPWFQLVRH